MTGEDISVGAHEHIIEVAKDRPALGLFERYLTIWVALCIVVGIVLGHWLPAPFHALGRLEVAQVNLPVAVLIWLMIIPMLMKIDFAALATVVGVLVEVPVMLSVVRITMATKGWYVRAR